MITERTANRLNALANKKGVSVQVAESREPKRRWYSVGNKHDGQWHQITGFSDSASVEQYISKFGEKK